MRFVILLSVFKSTMSFLLTTRNNAENPSSFQCSAVSRNGHSSTSCCWIWGGNPGSANTKGKDGMRESKNGMEGKGDKVPYGQLFVPTSSRGPVYKYRPLRHKL